MKSIDNSSVQTIGSDRSFERWQRLGAWYSSQFLRLLVPSMLRNAARELGTPILAPYVARHLPRDKEFDQSQEDALASSFMSIVVPIHDAPHETQRCLINLEKYAPKAEIILVDDASKPEETGVILEEFTSRNKWTLISHIAALGHSAACAAGAVIATRPYLCLLNSDTVVTPWCWRSIVKAFDEDSTIGVAGPSTSSGDPQTLPLAVLTRHYLNDSQICEYARLLLTEPSDTIHSDVRWVSGFAFFIRRCLWEELGGFDRNLVDYGNELDLCIRARHAGYRTVWVHRSYIHHLGGSSYGKVIGHQSVQARIRSALKYTEEKHRNRDV